MSQSMSIFTTVLLLVAPLAQATQWYELPVPGRSEVLIHDMQIVGSLVSIARFESNLPPDRIAESIGPALAEHGIPVIRTRVGSQAIYAWRHGVAAINLQVRIDPLATRTIGLLTRWLPMQQAHAQASGATASQGTRAQPRARADDPRELLEPGR